MKLSFFKILVALAIVSIVLPACKEKDTFDADYLPVRLSGSSEKWSILEVKSGKIIVEDAFSSEPSGVVDDMFYVKTEDQKFKFYNVNDINKQVGQDYVSATVFGDKRAIVAKEGETLSIIDTEGNVIKKLPTKIVKASSFENGYARVWDDEDKMGFIDIEGNIVVPMKYDAETAFSKDGFSLVLRGDDERQVLLINTKNETLFNLDADKYENLYYHDGLVAAAKENDLIYIDDKGLRVLNIGANKGEIGYYGFYKGLTIYANEEGLFGLKNKNGEVVLKASRYNELIPNKDGTYIAKKDGEYWIIDSDGEKIMPNEYNYIQRVNQDRYIASKGEKMFIIDSKGNIIGNEAFVLVAYFSCLDYSLAESDLKDESSNYARSYETEVESDHGTPTGDIKEDIKIVSDYILMKAQQYLDDEIDFQQYSISTEAIREEFKDFYARKDENQSKEFEEQLIEIYELPEIDKIFKKLIEKAKNEVDTIPME